MRAANARDVFDLEQLPGDSTRMMLKSACSTIWPTKNIPADLTPGERITDNAMKAFFLLRCQTVSDRKPSWYPESAEKGVIYAGFEKGPYYLRVAIEYSDSAIQTRLIESRNLSRTCTRVHKTSVLRIDQLEVKIRRALGQLAAVRALDGREPK